MTANCYHFKETLLYVFMRFSFRPNKTNLLYFMTTDIAEIFLTYIQLSFYIAGQITMIFLLYHCYLFLAAGLYRFEYCYLRLIMVTTLLCWATCVFLLNSFIFSISWDFFLRFQEYLSFQNLTFHFEVKLSEYLIFYKSVYYLCNFISQTAILFFIFFSLLNTNLLSIKKLRKVFYFFFFIFSTLVTPPEVVCQLVVSICIMSIYELVIFYIIFRTELDAFK